MPEPVFRSSNSVTTILGAYNQMSAFCDVAYQPDLRTTLNAKYNLNSGVGPSTVPIMRYFGIGIKGFKNTDGDQGSREANPTMEEMDLYEPVPFRVVPDDNDLDASERKMYRMRVHQTVDGRGYWCYYLKMIVWSPSRVEIIQKDAAGQETPYPLDPANLNPTFPVFETGGAVDTNQNRIIVRCTGICEVTGAEFGEAYDILYNSNENKGRISEFGFYTGEDVGVDNNDIIVPGSVGAVNLEAVYVQLAKKKCTKGIDATEPGFKMSPYISFEASQMCACHVNGV